MKKIHWKNFFICGLLCFAVLAIISTIFSYLSSNLYLATPNIWRDWNYFWLAATIFYYLFFAFTFSFLYALLYNGLPGQGAKGGIIFGFLVFLLVGFRGFLINYCSTILPLGLISMWAFAWLVNLTVMGAICGLIYKPKK